MDILTLIDLSSIFWQAWHASADQEIGAAYENTILKIYKHVNGDDPVAICVDKPPYKRKEIDSNYKAQRDKPSPVAVEQLRRVTERLEADGFPVLGVKGYEADDIIATICERTAEPTLIISSDKDLLQLVDKEVTVKSPLTGDEFGINEVVEKFGVMPLELGDWLALVGDKSDNVPGVMGVGAKTATQLLKAHKFEDLLKLIEIEDPDNEIQPAGVRQKLLDSYEDLKKSRELVRLMTDAEIEVDDIFQPREPKPMDVKPMEETTIEEPTSEPEPVQAKPPTAIVKADSWALRLEPNSYNEGKALSLVLFDSRLYQKFTSPQAILAVVMRGRTLGIDATTALDGFHIINGRPTLSAPLMIGLVIKSDVCDYFKCVETTERIATYITHRADDPEETSQRLSFTIEESIQMGQISDRWKRQPKTMLRWRCATELARMVYPDIVAGLYTPEELSEGQYVEVEVVDN